jgi:hypothetical protein
LVPTQADQHGRVSGHARGGPPNLTAVA